MSAEAKIRLLANGYAARLKKAIHGRVDEMKSDDVSHYLIYRVHGIAEAEGHLIDVYQNKGRFLYKYAGSFLEEATKLCFQEVFLDYGSVRIPNTKGQRPKTFEIDCLVGGDALEIKWVDATTDGDHITKEHTRIQMIANYGYIPIRVMFYYPNRTQAIRIQETLKTLYEGIGGKYHCSDAAWAYVERATGINPNKILEKLADEQTGVNQ
jgi:hypothetical protein